MSKFFDSLFRSATPAFQRAYHSAQDEARTRGREERLRTERVGLEETRKGERQEDIERKAGEREEDLLRIDLNRLQNQFQSLQSDVQRNPEKYTQETIDYINRAANFFSKPMSELVGESSTESAQQAQSMINKIKSADPEESSAALRELTGDLPLPDAEAKLKELETKARETRRALKAPPEAKIEFDPEVRKLWLEGKKLEDQFKRFRMSSESKTSIQTLLNSHDKNQQLKRNAMDDVDKRLADIRKEKARLEDKLTYIDEEEKITVRQQLAALQRNETKLSDERTALKLQFDEQEASSRAAQEELQKREGVKAPKSDINERKKEFILREKEKAIKERDQLMDSLRDESGNLSSAAQKQILERVQEMQREIKERADSIFGR